jgi:hypothetical protein
MTVVHIDTSEVERVVRNTIQYNEGFIAGSHAGLPVLLAKIGAAVVEALGRFIDMQAAGNPSALHHIYEWYQTGSAGARLFEFDYAVGGNTVTFNGSTTQSGSLSATATVPFYDKADIMESGTAISISPSSADVLAFSGGEGMVFTPNTIVVSQPGGPGVAGSFQRVVDQFFSQYFTQAFLSASGLLSALETPTAYAASFAAGALGGGYGAGFGAGYKYIADAPVGGLPV